MTLVELDTRGIHEWKTFHEVFRQAFGFPDFYGRNMDAWIDCMTNLDDPGAGLSAVHTGADGVLTLQLEHSDDFAARCPHQYAAIIECSAFMNLRRLEVGKTPILLLAFHRTPPATR